MANPDQSTGVTPDEIKAAVQNAAQTPADDAPKKRKKRGPYKKKSPAQEQPDLPGIPPAQRIVKMPDLPISTGPLLTEAEALGFVSTLGEQVGQLLMVGTVLVSKMAGHPILPKPDDAKETAEAIIKLGMLYGPQEVTAGTIAQLTVAAALVKMVTNAQTVELPDENTPPQPVDPAQKPET